MRALLLILLLLPGLARAAASNVFTSPRGTVTLISKTNAAAGGAVTLALRFDLAPGWHIYWRNPGDAGFPPSVALAAPAVAGGLEFPPPALLVQSGVAAYVLTGDVVLPFQATGVAGGQITAAARWLVCRDICIPEHAAFTLALAGGASAQAALFPAAPSLVASPFAARIAPDGTLLVDGLGAATVRRAMFFPDAPGRIAAAAPQVLRLSATGMALRLEPQPGERFMSPLSGVLEVTDRTGAIQALALTAVPGGAAAAGALPLLALAWLGGLILNLMPCVLPVLALKVFQLVRHGRQAARREAVGYTAGILTAMLALGVALLALRGFGQEAGWGFQLQSPPVVGLIALIVLGVTLNLAGVFAVPNLPLGRLSSHGGSFLTGLLAVAVAAPCTAPFMAGAIAAALAGPVWMALAVFLALGLGLATPFLAAGFIPGAPRLLPKPGRWMETLQHLLAIPMGLTFAWLAWVLWRQAGLPGFMILLLAGLLLGLGLARRRGRVAILAALAAVPLLHARPTAALTLPGAAPFSAARLASLRAGGQPVLVDVTAAWCITCLVNEHTALTAQAVQKQLALTHTALLVADWTDRDDALAAYLQANGRDGVPLAVFYPPGAAPRILPQVLTAGIVLGAMK